MKSELEQFINNNLEAFNNRVPDPAVLERLQQQMQQAGKKKQQAVVVPIKMLRLAAACFVLLAGGATFWIMQKEPVQKTMATTAVITEKPVIKPAEEPAQDLPSNKETTALRTNKFIAVNQELNSRKQVLFAKLNNMESPSQRLTAASQAYQLKGVGNDIVDALVKTMNEDPSTNVRLAALEGLSKFYREAYVKKQLISSLKKQKDPMVQIGLIELLTKMKESSILTELDKIVKDGNTMDAVKDRAYSSIFTLRS